MRPSEGRGPGRLLAGTSPVRRWSQTARRPAATRSEVGSTPTGVSSKQAAGPVGPAARLPRLRTVGGACPVQGIGTGAGPVRGSSTGRAPGWKPGSHGFESRPQHAAVGDEPTAPRRPQGRLDHWCPRGTGGRIGRPRPDRSVLRGRDVRAGTTRTDAMKHADSAALRRRQGAADAGACRGVSAPRRRPPKRTGPVGRGGSSGAPRPDA